MFRILSIWTTKRTRLVQISLIDFTIISVYVIWVLLSAIPILITFIVLFSSTQII